MLSSLSELASRVLLKFFGSRNQRLLEEMAPTVERINMLEPEISRLTDGELRARTGVLRERVRETKARLGYDEVIESWRKLVFERRREEAKEVRDRAVALMQRALDDVLVDAFALVREASKRTLRMRHYDVQLIGGMVLHQGKIAEMVTGEGKTLVASLPACLNALSGHGVHIVTVNDYLARRDADWNGPIYNLLGLTVGAIQTDMGNYERQRQYACDITYGTNNEFGFDYLRDNMKVSREQQAQGELHYAIIDEVDSILIDEARTPLIISGQAEMSTEKYYQADRAAKLLQRDEHFEVKEKEHLVILSEEGVEEAQRLIGVDDFYTGANMDWPHHLDQALKAHHLYQDDKDYVVEEGEVIIVDEFTGRKMPGRRWSDGLHQAVEAKEGLKIKHESQTLATVTLQNYFRLYDKLAGMTGTAQTEADEFFSTYKLDVASIPTNRPLRRDSWQDVIYRTHREKLTAIIDEIQRVHSLGRPMLVGTISVERSEQLSGILSRRGIPHEVLNAKNHEREANIVTYAGQLRQVTVATNMAGRGTDIILGMPPKEGDDLTTLCEWITRVFWLPGQKRMKVKELAEKPLDECRQALFDHADQFLRQRVEVWNEETGASVACDDLVDLDDEDQRRLLRRALRDVDVKDDFEVFRVSEPLVTIFEAAKNLGRYFENGVKAIGGLHVLGTERHEARRIDNQLRGRCGRQGDPGSSQFFLSLEDDLMRIFAPDRVSRILERLGMVEGQEISHRMVSRAIERAQTKVEARNFDIRKNLLEYDQVMDEQRKIVYERRQAILDGGDPTIMVLDYVSSAVDDTVESFASDEIFESERNYEGLVDWVRSRFDVVIKAEELTAKSAEEIGTELRELAQRLMKQREEELGPDALRALSRFLLLQKIDEKWKDHLLGMDQLRSGIGLRGYGQQDPKIVYKKEGYHAFQSMMGAVEDDITSLVFKVRLATPDEDERLLGRMWRQAAPVAQGPAKTSGDRPPGGSNAGPFSDRAALEGGRAARRAMERQQEIKERAMRAQQDEGPRRPDKVGRKVGRNDPCPCGSGKKYKKCCYGK
ncbi:preprotein translocase subunit SecA [Planctomycetota bacterium]